MTYTFYKHGYCDETWIYNLVPEIKMSSTHRKALSPPSLKNVKVTPSRGKVMLSYFLECEGIIMTDSMENE